MSQIRVLVVDDDPWILRMVSSSLEKKGTYSVDTARDGQQALRRVQAVRPDMIITDVMMPVMDGWAFVQELRADPDFADIPVLFLTALGKDEDRLHALGLKPDDYVSKPFRFDDLERRVLKCLAKRGKPEDAYGHTPGPGMGGGFPGYGHTPGPGVAGPAPGGQGRFGGAPGFGQPQRGFGGPAPGYGPQPGFGGYGPGPGYGPQGQGFGPPAYNPQAPAYNPQPSHGPQGSVGPSGPKGFVGPSGPTGYNPQGYGPGPAQPLHPSAPQHHAPAEDPGVPSYVDPGSSGSFTGAMKRTGLSGRLEQLGLSSLLVMMEMERKDGVLQIQNEDKRVGRIFLRRGQVIQARIDKDELERNGAESVYEMLTWQKGRFHFTAMDVDMEDLVQTSTTSLLMEGARLIDEANR